MLPLLREAPAGRIVITAISGGSLSLNSDPANPHGAMPGNYSVSKAVVNAVMLTFAIALEKTNKKVNAACAGFTPTALRTFNGTRSVEDGAREPVRLGLIGHDGPTGTFSDGNGRVPWCPLRLRTPDQEIADVAADRACDTRKCHDAVAEPGAVAVVPQHRNAKLRKAATAGAVARNEALRAQGNPGRAHWRRW